ncbi:MAG: glycosyl hydrolase 53 family protein [Theionarchaea archaeon]|nr:glycosyl hydrolase 53 family protein [Theionarchaea archaeon]MBU7037508.1 glycosyl hydrolase 53 family protein [Theionarchaea archaeon]
MKKRWLAVIIVGILLILVLMGSRNDRSHDLTPCSPPESSPVSCQSRPFYMGFTGWPPGPTSASISEMYKFVETNGDLIAHHFDGGIPWVEALADSEFSTHLITEWKVKKEGTSRSHKVLVAITPLDMSRRNLALYWGEKDNLPLPSPWDTYELDSHEVKTAYLNYATRVVEYFSPDYLVIGIEVNLLLAADPEKWEQYTDLHEYVYAALKKEYPDLPVFASFTLGHIKGLAGADSSIQVQELKEFMPYNDIMGLSIYPFLWAHPSQRLDPVPEDYFDAALQFGKPVAVTETGVPSQSFRALDFDFEFDEDYQKAYITLLLKKACDYEFVFVVNWAPLDFVDLLEVFPDELKELGKIWVYTGMKRSDGCPKKALSVWISYLDVDYRR